MTEGGLAASKEIGEVGRRARKPFDLDCGEWNSVIRRKPLKSPQQSHDSWPKPELVGFHDDRRISSPKKNKKMRIGWSTDGNRLVDSEEEEAEEDQEDQAVRPKTQKSVSHQKNLCTSNRKGVVRKRSVKSSTCSTNKNHEGTVDGDDEELSPLLEPATASKEQMRGAAAPEMLSVPPLNTWQTTLQPPSIPSSIPSPTTLIPAGKKRKARTRKILQRMSPEENSSEYTKTSVTITLAAKVPEGLNSLSSSHNEVHFFGGPPPTQKLLFFQMMKERESIRRKKEAGSPFPWTADPIFVSHKFTNVKRENDATTRWMREHWTGPHAASSDFGTVIFNCAVFRYFGTTELGEQLKWSEKSYIPDDVVRAAIAIRAQGKHAFTSAYCRMHFNSEVTSPGHGTKNYKKISHRYLASLWKARRSLSRLATDTRSWRRLVEELRSGQNGILGFGGTGFMAKECVLDAINASPRLRDMIDDVNQWCPCGPGARRGLNRIFGRPTEFSVTDFKPEIEALFIDEMKSLLAEANKTMPEWCRELDLELHDIQFQLCEYDKYERVANHRHEHGTAAKYLPAGQRPPVSPLSAFDEAEAEKLLLESI